MAMSRRIRQKLSSPGPILAPPHSVNASTPQARQAPGAVDLRKPDFDGTPIQLDVMQIRSYDDNPRFFANDSFADIKAGLRANGFTGAFAVTRRRAAPGEPYMLCAGGNSTLEALRQLYNETSHERFKRVNCVFHDYQGEEAILAQHLGENLNRGDMRFWEVAVGVSKLAAKFGIGEESYWADVVNPALINVGVDFDQAQPFSAAGACDACEFALAEHVGGDESVTTIRSMLAALGKNPASTLADLRVPRREAIDALNQLAQSTQANGAGAAASHAKPSAERVEPSSAGFWHTGGLCGLAIARGDAASHEPFNLKTAVDRLIPLDSPHECTHSRPRDPSPRG